TLYESWSRPPSMRRSDLHRSHDPFGKDFFRRRATMRNPLLVHIAEKLVEGGPVLLDTIGEGIPAEQVAHPAGVGRKPGERIARHGGIEQPLQAAALGFEKSVVEIARHPWVFFENRFLQRDDVHDR